MMKSVLTAGVSLLALAAVSAAEAKTVGHVAGGVNYVDWDDNLFGGKNVDWWQFNFQGAAAFDLTPTWNVQFDTSFNSDRLSGDAFSGKSIALDTWRAGTELFWRDSTQGMFGLEVAYQTLDQAQSLDGVFVGLRGEYYSSDAFTFGGGVNYNTFETSGVSLDTWGANLFGTYYANEKTGISLRGNYASTDLPSSSPEIDTWGISADVEYLFQNNLSLTGSIGYTRIDVVSDDLSRLTVGAKLKVYFGTEGSLANQHRTGTLEPTTAGFNLPFFGL